MRVTVADEFTVAHQRVVLLELVGDVPDHAEIRYFLLALLIELLAELVPILTDVGADNRKIAIERTPFQDVEFCPRSGSGQAALCA